MAIIERVWRTGLRRTEQDLAHALSLSKHLRRPVYHWTGLARDGSPLTITWLADKKTGTLLSAYEITTD